MKLFQKNVIALKLIACIFLFSFSVTLILSTVELSFDYRRSIESLRNRVAQIRDSHISTLAERLWNFDEEGLATQLSGIIQQPDIEYVGVVETSRNESNDSNKREIIFTGKVVSKNHLRDEFPLVYKDDDHEAILGKLTVVASLDRIRDRLMRRIIFITLSNTLKIFLVSLFVFFIVQRLIAGRLVKIANYADNMDEGGRSEPLYMPGRQSWRSRIFPDDELDQVVASINRMNLKLREYSGYQKLAAIGQSTAMVAHDIRKPLSGMKALLTSLAHLKDDPGQIKKMMASVDRNIAQTNAMLNDILEFSKDGTSLEKTNIDPMSVITSSLSDVFTSLSHGDGRRPDVAVTYDLKHRNCLNVDGNRIVRVLANIVGNAVEATGAKGRLWIGTEDLMEDGTRMRLTVGNDGPLIPEDVQERMFEPFFTKGKKGGSGLGLSITQKIVEMHGGKIGVSSKAEKGGNRTEFVIELPATAANLAIREEELIRHSDEFETFLEEEKLREEHGETENIAEFMRLHKEHGMGFYLLIVDDEPLFRETVRTLLYSVSQVKDHVKVVEASSAEEGLSLFKAREFDYVIADIDMGKRNMNGYEMAERILKTFPKTKVLIHSNKRRAEMDRGIRDLESENFLGFLPKPMNQQEIVQFMAGKTFEAKRGEVGVDEKRKNILVVNDDDAIRVMFRLILKTDGVEVLGASSVGEAIQKLAQNEFDVILVDVNLGEGEPSGYDFLKKVKEGKKASRVYMVSGYSAQEEWPKAKELGADGYFQLPVDDAAIKSILN